jgi:GTP pyrophosphokinase
MGHDGPNEAADLRFVVAVRDTTHLDIAMRNLRRTTSVLRAERSQNAAQETD